MFMKNNDSLNGIKGKVKLTWKDAKSGKILVIEEFENIFCTVGKNSIAQRLSGNTTGNIGIINYCAVGTNGTAANIADIKLGTELFRKLVSVRTVTGNAVEFRTFFTESEANGTLLEVGLFGDNATITADSGVLYSHRVISRTKTNLETLTVDWTLTIS